MWGMSYSSKTFLERFRDWDWDFLDIWSWVFDTAAFHIEKNGFVAVLVIAVVVIFILLQIDMTSYVTELVLASAVRSLATFLTMITGGTLIMAIVKLFQLSIARGRNSMKNIKGILPDKNRGS